MSARARGKGALEHGGGTQAGAAAAGDSMELTGEARPRTATTQRSHPLLGICLKDGEPLSRRDVCTPCSQKPGMETSRVSTDGRMEKTLL